MEVAAQPAAHLVARPLGVVGAAAVELEPLEVARDLAGERLGDHPGRGVADARQLPQPPCAGALARARPGRVADDVGGLAERLDLVPGVARELEQERDAVQCLERLHQRGTVPVRSMADDPYLISVERVIPAPAGAHLPDLLADPARHRDIDGSGTVREAKDVPSEPLHLGSTFGMSMKAGIPYSMVNTVIEYEENRRIAWQTRPAQRVREALRWTHLAVRARTRRGGTLVRETWDIRQETAASSWCAGAGKHTRQAMEQTLERIETLVTG